MPIGTPMSPARIAITTGEPAGIGPEIALRAALQVQLPCTLVGDPGLLAAAQASLGLAQLPGHIEIHPIALAASVQAGVLDPRNARYVLATLDHALEGWRQGRYRAMVTAPVHKGVINEAGVAFTGHTEYLAQATGSTQVVMMLVGGGLRVALATTHLPLRAVPDALSQDGLAAVLEVLHADLRRHFACPAPRIAVTGLNPHAGEGGHLGREEIELIGPAIAAARARGMDASGPWPADTVFLPRVSAGFDAILAMYHDQGLGPLKLAGGGEGVNVTLGLPVVRTSVDHGTALDLAGTGRADAASMVAALRLAAQMAGMQAPGPQPAGAPPSGAAGH
jgi:4-hydroxythreonine-4-phosphate dehydrogenase